MDLYILIGEANTRKSSCIRALGGFHGTGQIFDIAVSGQADKKVYCQVSALQEKDISPQAFIRDIISNHNGQYDSIIVPLRIRPARNQGDYITYINSFSGIQNVDIKFIEVLGKSSLSVPLQSQTLTKKISFIPLAASQPTNKTAHEIRQRWGWL